MGDFPPAGIEEMMDRAEADDLGMCPEDYARHCSDYALWLDASAADLPEYE